MKHDGVSSEHAQWVSDELAEVADLFGIEYVKTNHPVPAIRLDVEILPDRVMIWDYTKWCYTYLALAN